MEPCPKTLARNLEALQGADAELAARLLLPVESDHVVRGPAGELLYKPHLGATPLELDAPRARRAVEAAAAPSGELVLLGLGAGELLDAALATDAPRVTAWERDPWLLRLTLATRDVAAPLAAGRLRLLLGTDLLRLAPGAAGRVVHPLLEHAYARELRLAAGPPAARRAVLCAGGVLVDDVGRALAAAGLAPYTLDVERLAVEELDRSLVDLEPAVVVSIDYRHGLAEFCRDRGVPLVVWEADPATTVLPPLEGPCPDAHVFTYRRENVAAFREAGFQDVHYLPLAADPGARVAPADAVRGRHALSFVGSSMVESAAPFAARFVAAAERCAGLDRAAAQALLREVLGLQCANPFRFLLPEALEERAPGFRGRARVETGEDPVVLAGELAASERRLGLARALGPLGLEVWGDPGWARAEGNGTRYRGLCGHGRELDRVYAESAVNLDVGRVFQRDIVTMRVFDVLAVGGFALVEHSEALEELFEVGAELESYRSLEELALKAAWARTHPEDAREIARRGHRAVVERHTVAARLARMLDRAGVAAAAPGAGAPGPASTALFGIPLG